MELERLEYSEQMGEVQTGKEREGEWEKEWKSVRVCMWHREWEWEWTSVWGKNKFGKTWQLLLLLAVRKYNAFIRSTNGFKNIKEAIHLCIYAS